MPPVSQGSRTGLITAVVIFAILFVTSTIFAIFYGVEAAKAREEQENLRRQTVNELIATGGMTTPVVERLKAVRTSGDTPGITPQMPLLDVAVTQRDRLSRMVDPGAQSAAAAETSATQALAAAAEIGDVTLPSTSDNLTGAVSTLTRALLDGKDKIAALNGEVESLTKRLEESAGANTAELAKKDEIVADIRKQTQDQIATIQSDLTKSQQVVKDLEKARQQERTTVGGATDELNVQLAQAQKEAADTRAELDKMRALLDQGRVRVDEPMFREPDGKLLTVSGVNGTVYINLGQGDQIIPGMTFEVYDKITGMPRVQINEDPDNETMPEGKASIEVIRVGKTSSEARVTRRSSTNGVLTEGDLIANLVYDKNTKYNFMVYGQFDLDRKGVPNDQDTEIIRRLITQWGGEISDDVRVSTDFLVVGTEPALPEYTREELQLPENNARMIEAQARLDAYLAVIQKATELRVPILNQNRFLHFIGYYDQSRR